AEFIPDWFAHQLLLVPSGPPSPGRTHGRRAWPGNYRTRICGIERDCITRRGMTFAGGGGEPARSRRGGYVGLSGAFQSRFRPSGHAGQLMARHGAVPPGRDIRMPSFATLGPASVHRWIWLPATASARV